MNNTQLTTKYITMKQTIIALLLLVLLSCGKNKSVLLPEIEHAKITEIADVSPIYLFYDETKPERLDLNANNSIISTNWLVNIDKRLTLKQILPSIIKLQKKKLNSDHKNESARNYYTCNDTSIKNLGFIDFTDVVYDYEEGKIEKENHVNIIFKDIDDILILSADGLEYKTNLENFENQFIEIISENTDSKTVQLSFNDALVFQDYITLKSKLSQLNLENTLINNEEFIFN